MIGKELLSEVFTDNQQNFKVNKIEKNILHYSWLMEEFFGDGDVNCKWIDMSINIYELAHRCKEWAFDSFYLSIITFKINDDLYKCEIADIKDSLGEWSNKYSFRIDNEVEAIFKACEWILDNKGNK